MARLKIAVVGAGANGGALAASLTAAGEDVICFDPWVDHVAYVRHNGLRVESTEGRTVTPLDIRHVCQVAEPHPLFDLLIIGVKAYDTRWVCELMRPHLADDGTVVAIQNGITLETVADVFGDDRSVGAVIEVAANLMVPGHIVQEAPIWLAVGGETPASQRRAEAVAPVLRTGATVEVVDDIRSAKWMKLVANACELVPSAILDLPLADAIRQPGMYDFMLEAGQEALDTALARGQQIVPIFGLDVDPAVLTRDRYVRHLLDAVLDGYTSPTTLTTVLQDWRKGRRAEIEDLNGLVVSAAEGLVATPANERILRLALNIEAGVAQSGVANMAALAGHERDVQYAG